jgi:hypothetical protein
MDQDFRDDMADEMLYRSMANPNDMVAKTYATGFLMNEYRRAKNDDQREHIGKVIDNLHRRGKNSCDHTYACDCDYSRNKYENNYSRDEYDDYNNNCYNTRRYSNNGYGHHNNVREVVKEVIREVPVVKYKEVIKEVPVVKYKEVVKEVVKEVKEKISYIVECPTCRKINEIPEKQNKVYGLDITCAICLDKKVDVFLPACGHLCICLACCATINKQ